jgi:hypothetical protein
MAHFGQIIEFSSSRFPHCEEDDELVNGETMHGIALARHIGQRLPAHGFRVADEIPEDWGWLMAFENEGFELWYGVMSYERGDDFMIQFHPDKPFIRKWFKKIDVSERVKLQDAVFAILQETDGSAGPEWV